MTPSPIRAALARAPAAAWLLAALPAVATLGEGGASALGLLAWHSLLVALVIAALLERGAEESSRPRGMSAGPFGAWLLFLTIAAAGAARAPYAYAAWLNGVELAAFTAVALLAARRGPALIRTALGPLSLAAVAQSLLALFQRFGQGQPRPAGTFLNPNHLGGFLVVVLLLVIGHALATTERRLRVAALAVSLPCLAALLVSGSRGALLAGIAGGALLVAGVWSKLEPRRRLALVAVCVLAAAPIGFRVAQRLTDTDPYLFHRVKIWRASAGVLAASPLWGSGPGQFVTAAARFQFDDGHGPLRFDRAFRVTHSDLLRAQVEYGLPAALALALALLAATVAVVRGRRSADPAVPPGVVAALAAAGAQALVDNPSRWPALYLLVALLLGVLLSRSVPRRRRGALTLRGALAGVLALLFVVGELGPTVAYLKVRGLPPAGLSDEDLRALDLATLLNPVQPGPWLRRSEHLVEGDGKLSLAAYVDARESAERAIRLSPLDSRYHWGLARVEGQGCLRLFRTEASRNRTYERLERSQELSPSDARISLHAAEFGLAVGDPEYARRMAERALAIEPGAVVGHVLLARALLVQDPPDRRRATELVEQAVQLAVRHAASAKENGYARALLTLNMESLTDFTENAPPAGTVGTAE